MIKHHLDDDMLVDYSAGTLAEGWSVAVATHLALCPACRTKIDMLDSVGGYFLQCEDADEEDLPESWQAIRARIAAGEIEAVLPIKNYTTADPTFPEPLRSYISKAGGVKWRRLGLGAAQMIIPTEDSTTTVRLLKIPTGRPVPEHSHKGSEMTLVLDGNFSDEVSTFRRGDVEMADGNLMHQPRAGTDKDCICLAVTDAPLRFTSRLMRWMQPVLGI
ncbi:transcriptional regulator [Neorhizobium sp. P12A]|uniref:ChrR family anti-sigma-E factor n=1 Tax=Neorhizobium sp. P12A TaxID=2268027 RepID=UPI0011EFFA17|nr:ChrR family anti-sigma-E factor [Neorhizobium sp. P12A]KAA0682028.1 transcriptional regulator [Neorhizobium sp. P12A]